MAQLTTKYSTPEGITWVRADLANGTSSQGNIHTVDTRTETQKLYIGWNSDCTGFQMQYRIHKRKKPSVSAGDIGGETWEDWTDWMGNTTVDAASGEVCNSVNNYGSQYGTYHQVTDKTVISIPYNIDTYDKYTYQVRVRACSSSLNCSPWCYGNLTIVFAPIIGTSAEIQADGSLALHFDTNWERGGSRFKWSYISEYPSRKTISRLMEQTATNLKKNDIVVVPASACPGGWQPGMQFYMDFANYYTADEASVILAGSNHVWTVEAYTPPPSVTQPVIDIVWHDYQSKFGDVPVITVADHGYDDVVGSFAWTSGDGTYHVEDLQLGKHYSTSVWDVPLGDPPYDVPVTIRVSASIGNLFKVAEEVVTVPSYGRFCFTDWTGEDESGNIREGTDTMWAYLGLNCTCSVKASQDKEEAACAGRRYPVARFGSQSKRTISLSADIPDLYNDEWYVVLPQQPDVKISSTRKGIAWMDEYREVLTLRIPDTGERYHVVVDNISWARSATSKAHSVDIDCTVVDWT